MNILVIKHGSLGDLVLSFGAIKSLMPKLTVTASEGTDIKKVSVGNYMERKLSNYEFDKLFG